jgi:hypothetical protein
VLLASACAKNPPPEPIPAGLPPPKDPATARGSPLPETSAAAPVAAGRCDVKSCNYREQTCCEAESDRHMTGCVSKKGMSDNAHKCYGALEKDWIGIECLTSADCSNNELCCASGFEVTFNHCAAECEIHEACMPSLGGTGGCRKGFNCEPVSEARSGGVCLFESPQTACGKLRCSGATPDCCYDLKKKSGRCTAPLPDRGQPESQCPYEHNAYLACTTPADCGGEHCCLAGPVIDTQCSGMCMSGGWACGSLKDCPDFIGPAIACEADPEYPPFLKTCKYRSSKGEKF